MFVALYEDHLAPSSRPAKSILNTECVVELRHTKGGADDDRHSARLVDGRSIALTALGYDRVRRALAAGQPNDPYCRFDVP